MKKQYIFESFVLLAQLFAAIKWLSVLLDVQAGGWPIMAALAFAVLALVSSVVSFAYVMYFLSKYRLNFNQVSKFEFLVLVSSIIFSIPFFIFFSKLLLA